LTAGAWALLYWIAHHREVSFADGLRYVHEAQQIDRGDLAGGLLHAIDHPLHLLAIAGAHSLLGGEGPFAWQAAAQAASVLALVLSILPLYLLALELFDDDTTAGLACVLVFANPVIAYISVNVLSETTFLLFWTWGLWAAVRFLREGRFVWLPPTIACGALAYLTRPEGILIHLALVATLVLLPLHKVTRIYWPRWWAAVSLLVLGPALLVGPYVAIKGGIGTKPAVARVIGTMPESPPSALERERIVPPGQSTAQTYAIAVGRMLKAFRGVVTWPLVPLAVLGLVVARPGAAGARLWLFLGVIVTASAVALVRLHATGGYLTVRHALVPGIPLLFSAAHGLAWVMRKVSLDARWLGLGEGRLRPGPAVWALVVGALVAWPVYRSRMPYQSSFAAYRQAGSWIASQSDGNGRVLDMTDWSLFFSGRNGLGFDAVGDVASLPQTRWVVVRDAHLQGHGRSSEVARELVAGRLPVARFPENAGPEQVQVFVYDLASPALVPSSLATRRSGLLHAPAAGGTRLR
jgi:hypothetical protein